VIIHYGPLERPTLKSLLLINSETVSRGLITILRREWREVQTRPGSDSSFLKLQLHRLDGTIAQ